jgi:hypothetical protein
LPATADREVLNFYAGPTARPAPVDGAPAARFAETFGRLLEGGAGLDDGFLAEATELSGVLHALAR